MQTIGLGTLIETYRFWRSPLARIKHSRERVAHERKTYFDMLNVMQVSLRTEDHHGVFDSESITMQESSIPKAVSDEEIWKAEQEDNGLQVGLI